MISLSCSSVSGPSLSQYFQATVAGETCGTVIGDPISPATVELYLWWPNTVGKAMPTLLEATTQVAILVKVSGCV